MPAQFESNPIESPRVHVALAVADLRAAVDFYRRVFAVEPTRVEARYSRFELSEPGLLLALNERAAADVPRDRVSHFGVQVASSAEVEAAARRLAGAGLAVEVEERVDCCYAVQDKVWVTDPDGHRWEFFTILAEGAHHAPSRGGDGCCEGDHEAGTCGTTSAVGTCGR